MKVTDRDKKNFKKELLRLHKIMKVEGWKSDDGREAMTKEVNLKEDYVENFGKDALTDVLFPKCKTTFRLHNSKGNDYSNM